MKTAVKTGAPVKAVPHQAQPDGGQPFKGLWTLLSRLAKPKDKHRAAIRRFSQRKGRWDEVKLYQMGYKQEMPRRLTLFNNASCTFSVLSFFAIVESYSTQGLAYGGPVVMVWGWIVVSFFSLVIAACLAELVSAFPTSGGLYYWSWILAPSKWRNFTCWMTGWLNLLGQVAFTTSLEVSLTRFISTLISLHTVSGDGVPSFTMTANMNLAIFAAFIIIHATMNSINQDVMALFFTISSLWHIIAATAFCVILILVAPTHQPSSFVWFAWNPNSDINGIDSSVYIVLVGLLFSQWVIMSFDTCTNMCEETIDGDRATSWATMLSVSGCAVFGLGFILSLNYCIQSVDSLFDTNSVTGGSAVAQLTWDVFVARFGHGLGALPLLYIPAVGLFFCAFTSLTSNGRMIFAFSRDGAMLGSNMYKKLSKQRLPVAGTWGMALLCFLMGLPAIYNTPAFNTISATSVVSLSLSYGIPIALRYYHGPNGFIAGPFRLGRWSGIFGLTSCAWIGLISVVFCLPTVYPVTRDNMNYSAVSIAATVSLALITWYCPVWGGYNWFTGPQPNITVGFVDNTGNTPTGAVPDNLLLHDETVGRLEFAAKSEARLRRRPTDDKLTTLSRHMSMAAMQQLMSVSQRTQSVACTELEDNNGWVGRGSVPRGDVERGSAMLELLRHADVSTGQNVEAAAWRMERPKHLSFTAVNTKHKVSKSPRLKAAGSGGETSAALVGSFSVPTHPNPPHHTTPHPNPQSTASDPTSCTVEQPQRLKTHISTGACSTLSSQLDEYYLPAHGPITNERLTGGRVADARLLEDEWPLAEQVAPDKAAGWGASGGLLGQKWSRVSPNGRVWTNPLAHDTLVHSDPSMGQGEATGPDSLMPAGASEFMMSCIASTMVYDPDQAPTRVSAPKRPVVREASLPETPSPPQNSTPMPAPEAPRQRRHTDALVPQQSRVGPASDPISDGSPRQRRHTDALVPQKSGSHGGPLSGSSPVVKFVEDDDAALRPYSQHINATRNHRVSVDAQSSHSNWSAKRSSRQSSLGGSKTSETLLGRVSQMLKSKTSQTGGWLQSLVDSVTALKPVKQAEKAAPPRLQATTGRESMARQVTSVMHRPQHEPSQGRARASIDARGQGNMRPSAFTAQRRPAKASRSRLDLQDAEHGAPSTATRGPLTSR